MASKKLDPRIAQLKKLQNYVRGSTNPLGAMSNIRGRVPKSELANFVAWLPTVRRRGHGVFAGHYPAVLSDLCREGALAAVGVEREIAWTAAIIRQNYKAIEAFVKQSERYETALVNGRTEDCRNILSEIELQFGFSLWSIETRLALLQQSDGLEAQKEYALRVRNSRTKHDIVAFLAHFVSRRNEPATTPIRFVSQLKEQIVGWNPQPDFKAYILFRLANQPAMEEEEFSGILRYETGSSIIDQYDTFIRLGQHAAVFGNAEIRSYFSAELIQIANEIDDERVRRLLFIITEDPSWIDGCSEGSVEAYDAILNGDYEKAFEAAEIAITAAPLDVDLWIKLAEAAYGANHLLKCGPTLRDAVISNLLALVGKQEGQEEAVIALLKDGLNHRLQSFAAGIDDLVWRELSTDPRGLPSTVSAFLQARYLRPCNIHSLATEKQRLGLMTLLAASFKSSALFHDMIVRSNLDAESEKQLLGLEPSTLVPEAHLEARIGSYLSQNQYEEVLSLTEEIKSTTDPLRRQSVIRYLSICLLRMERIDELVPFVAQSFIATPELINLLPISACAERLNKDARRRLAGELSVCIVLDLYSKHFEDRFDDIRNYAYEDFLLSLGLERPSQLGQIAGKFDLGLLTYYLRYICIPTVMQVSSVFGGTRELEEERKNVLSILVKLDAKNAKEYETELRDVTRAQLIHRGVRQVEQSKIYVDISAIRRLFEKEHKENFQRYQALLRAGVGNNDDAFVEALENALSGAPLPQSFLEIPKDETNDLLLLMLGRLFDECRGNAEHGLDCYLSMRIRHGTLSGQLRSPLEIEKIITLRAAGTDEYESNDYWLDFMGHLSIASQQAINDRLARFSADYDALIANITNNLIQIHSAKRPAGLFNIGVKSVAYRLWVTEITAEMTFDAFFDKCIELFWKSVETSLDVVRTVIDRKLKPEVTAMFSNLEFEIRALAVGGQTAALDRAMRTAQTGAQQALDLVKDWFRLSQPISEPNFPIEDLIDVGLQCVRTIHHDFDPIITRDVAPLPPFAGALVLFSDIFFIIFDNIRRHSGVGGRPKVIINIEDRGDHLSICTRSEISVEASDNANRSKIERIREIIVGGDYQRSVSSEGGTGLIKLRKLIGTNEKKVRRLDFGFGADGFFYVELELGKREIQL